MAEGVILFPSIHFALQAEKLVKGKGFKVKLIPVPRQLSSDCGVCLKIPWEEEQAIGRILEEAGVKMDGKQPLSDKK